ncbi:hypothetical protein GDO81_021558 [Engystomops pustulosus]|uniref:Frog antimicrobial peptide propeptide domain-containing protein n=1 Tax=Engystomops pustulosus TaxID=76066 RepID=A0AAV6ZC71_ENGPU|nr:hypothetical protein GDO81_021558 [Engystomops pustulosus]
MTFLKKSLFLVLFLGLVSLSICDDEKRDEYEKILELSHEELDGSVRCLITGICHPGEIRLGSSG